MNKRRTFIKQATTLGALYPFSKTGYTTRTENKLNIVCVGGHPDDPETGCGGTLSLYANAGHNVSNVYLTKGEAGIIGKNHKEAALIRTQEAEAACAAIGAKPYFFGQTDGDTQYNKTEVTKMQQLLTKLQPDILLTHWPLDSHADHQIAFLLSYQSWLRMDKTFAFYFFEVNSGEQSVQFAPTDYIDITPVATQKKKAIYAHKSQGPDDIYTKHHYVMQQFRGREIGVKEAEAFIRLGAHKQTWLT